jgi:hypothetical protein
MQTIAAMIDDTQFDRAVVDVPAAIRARDETNRLADQRVTEIDLGAVPADGAVAVDPPQRRLGRVFGRAQDAVPAPRRGPVVLGRGGVAERRMRPLLVVDALKVAKPPELLAQAARRRSGGIAQQGQMQPFEPAILLRFAGGDALWPHPALMTLTASRDNPPAPIDANGGPLSERSRSGRPNSRKAASSTGQTCSVLLRPRAWQRNR